MNCSEHDYKASSRSILVSQGPLAGYCVLKCNTKLTGLQVSREHAGAVPQSPQPMTEQLSPGPILVDDSERALSKRLY